MSRIFVNTNASMAFRSSGARSWRSITVCQRQLRLAFELLFLAIGLVILPGAAGKQSELTAVESGYGIFGLTDGYRNLVDDTELAAWMTLDGQDVSEGWKLLADGTLHFNGTGGEIVTREVFGDFDLRFQFCIPAGGNNGIKYRVRNLGNTMSGLEYQIQDDQALAGLPDRHKTASIYDLLAPSRPSRQYQAGEFQSGRIVVQDNRIRHWLNGELVIDESVDSPVFEQALKQSKFRNRPTFGCNRFGRLMLTRHGSEVWFRNLRVRRLDTVEAV